jgi:hypothetical protein
MNMHRTVQAGILTLCLAATPTFAATHHRWHRPLRDTQVVDVNAHALPPPPPHARHVVVVNSAQNARRHHGVAGMFQRVHKWHMRQRAKLYRTMFK